MCRFSMSGFMITNVKTHKKKMISSGCITNTNTHETNTVTNHAFESTNRASPTVKTTRVGF